MGWTKKDEYEILMGRDENRAEGKKRGIAIHSHHSPTDWWSENITIKGETPTINGTFKNKPTIGFHRISTVMHRNRDECLIKWQGVSEEIPGLKCYYCNSQGFRTDQPGVAVCGAAPGWFFFYRRLMKEKKGSLKIKNGKLVEEIDETPDEV